MVLAFLNIFAVVLSQNAILKTHYDLFYFAVLFYRIIVFFVIYIVGLFLISLLKIKFLENLALGVLLIFSGILFMIDFFLINTFGAHLNTFMISTFFNSNLQESKEFLQTYFSYKLLFSYIVILCICIALYKIPLIKKPHLKYLKWIVLVLLICIIALNAFRLRTGSQQLIHSDVIYKFIKSLNDTLTYYKEFKKNQQNYIDNFDVQIKDLDIKVGGDLVENVVLVIGESASRNKHGIYGYSLNTTPYLENLKGENLFIFNDVISSQSSTFPSLSQALTFANNDNKNEWFKTPNLIDIINNSGHETISISNQEGISFFGHSIDTILKRANKSFYMNYGDSWELTRLDEDILPILDSVLSTTNEPRFFVLHLMGSHANYRFRYAKNFNKFKSQDIESNLKFINKEVLALYLNSILYTDFVLNEIINRFKDRESLVIYFSDHGEEVFDIDGFCGHGKASKYVAEIPFIIYASEKFALKYPELVAKIKIAQNNKYMNDDFIHSILDLLSISVKDYEPKRSIFSKDKTFLDKRERIVNQENTRNYDEELK